FRFLSSKKKNDFRIFKKIVKLIEKNEHLTENGIKKILSLRTKLNKDCKKIKYKDEEIIEKIERGKGSSETIRQAFLGSKKEPPDSKNEDMVQTLWQHKE
ncbi:MAG: hypothetical protein ACP5KI_07465, partial [Brevinematia bacterium]